MAYITQRGKSYLIRVSCGRDAHGHKVTQSVTWTPPKPNMSEKQIQKALNDFAVLFEQECHGGTVVNQTKFAAFAETWFSEYASSRLKASTIIRTRQLTERTYRAIGHLRLDSITPRHIQGFVNSLNETSLDYDAKCICRVDLKQILKDKGLTQAAFASMASVNPHTVRRAIDKQPLTPDTATNIAKALDLPFDKVFDKQKDGRTLSPKTVMHYISFISSVFDYAQRLQLIKDNPCAHIFAPKQKAHEKDIYTPEQARRILELLQDAPLKYRAFFTLAMYSGMRRGELLGLEWSDIDFDSGVVNIQRNALYSKEKGHYTDTTKTAASTRCLKLPKNVIFVLQQLRNEQLSERLKLGDAWHVTNRLFVTWDGQQMNGATPYSWYRKFCDKNGLPFHNIHSFRHLHASLLIDAGVNVRTVSAVLGHSQTSTTLNIYAHNFQEATAKAADAVADILTDTASTSKQA